MTTQKIIYVISFNEVTTRKKGCKIVYEYSKAQLFYGKTTKGTVFFWGGGVVVDKNRYVSPG